MTSLVEALNICENWFAERGVHEWFQSSIEWFTRKTVADLSSSEMKEYAALGKLKPRCRDGRALLKAWFDSICQKMAGDRQEAKLIDCVNRALECIDARVFGGDPTCVIHLAIKLLEKLEDLNVLLTKETYRTYGSTLFALHRAVIITGEVEPHLLDPKDDNGVSQRFRNILRKIIDGQHYYPYRYQAEMIEQSMKCLESDGKFFGPPENLRRCFFGAYAIVCLLEEVRALSTLEFDHSAFEAAAANWNKPSMFERIRRKEAHLALLDLSSACLKCVQDPSRIDDIEELCEKLLDRASLTLIRGHRMALRYGVVDQLHMLAIHGSELHVRTRAIRMLVDLGMKPELRKRKVRRWTTDPEVDEALFEALHSVYTRADQSNIASVREAIQSLLSSEMRPRTSSIANEILVSMQTERNETRRSNFSTGSSHLYDDAENRIDALRQVLSDEEYQRRLRSRHKGKASSSISPTSGGTRPVLLPPPNNENLLDM